MTAMGKGSKRILPVLLAAWLVMAAFPALARDGFDTAYTYSYDYWGDLRKSPDPYRVETVLTSSLLGLDIPMKAPQGLFVRGNMIYICDTGNNRILEIEREEDGCRVKRIIDSFYGDTTPLTFSAPYDIFVSEAGEMFICDFNNKRVVKLDKDLKFLLAFTRPDDATFDASLSFLPIKVVADSTGRAFILGRNVNKGMIKYESDGAFAGFIGASDVKFWWYDYIWRLLSTREQRARQASFVPTEYDNLFMDREGFIYCVTGVFSENELMNDQAKPIRRINGLGSDILVKNGTYPPIGDLQWDTLTDYAGPSRFSDITVLDKDVYVVTDRVHGRLFGYDQQGRLLWVFGGVGNMEGYFQRPAALEHMGDDLLVLDSMETSLTIFTPTPYGSMIYQAIQEYRQGRYDDSVQSWREVLEQNGNYDLAYIGIGRALLRQDRYEEAMAYFKLTRDSKNYSDAFKQYRKKWVEEHSAPIFLMLALLMVVPPIVGRIKKIKREVEAA